MKKSNSPEIEGIKNHSELEERINNLVGTVASNSSLSGVVAERLKALIAEARAEITKRIMVSWDIEPDGGAWSVMVFEKCLNGDVNILANLDSSSHESGSFTIDELLARYATKGDSHD